MTSAEDYINGLNVSLEQATAFLSNVDKGCACIGCPPGVECRRGMCSCTLYYTASKRVVLRQRAKEVRDARANG